MRGVRHFPTLRAWGLGTFGGYRAKLDDVGPALVVRDREALSSLTLAAANSWVVLIRSFYLASMTGALHGDNTKSKNTVNVKTPDEAITFAVHQRRPSLVGSNGPWTHREEPDWSDAGIVASILSAAGASTAPDFGAAISLGTGARQDLATYRNFVAHMNSETARKVRNLGAANGVNRSLAPIRIPLQRRRNRPQSLLADWLDDLWTIVSFFPA